MGARHRDISFLLAALLILSAVFSFLSIFFLTAENILNILLATSTIGILGVGAAFVIAAGGIDLSIGSLLAFSSVAAVVTGQSLNLMWPWVVLLCLAAGMIAGVANGLLIAKLSLPPFIVTLGMMSIARGLALVIAGGRPVYGLDPAVVAFGQGRIGGIPVPVIIFLAAVVVMHIVLTRTRFGRITLCLGDNEEAVRNAGVCIALHKTLLYMLSGFLAGLAGLLSMSRVNAADPAIGMGYELAAITAALLGGTNLSGGKASVIGVLLGALIMGVLQNGLTLLAVPSYYQQLVIGFVLIAAVATHYHSRQRYA